jgi:hypothetical protein
MSCDQLHGYFRSRLALSRSIHVDSSETTRSKEGDDIPQFNRGQMISRLAR